MKYGPVAFFIGVSVAMALAPALQATEPQSLTFRIDCWRAVACDGPENDYEQAALPHVFTCEYEDPLVPGSVVRSFEFKPQFQAHASGLGGYLSTAMNGVWSGDGQFGDVSVLQWGCDRPSWVLFPFRCHCLPPASGVHEDGFPEYKPGATNRFELHVRPEWNPWGHIAQMRLAHVEVTLSYNEGGTIRFDLDDTSHADARKILIARHRTDIPYSSPAQKADGRIEIRAHAGAPGRRVYFRVIDPPDTAPYVPAADRVPNDNVGGTGQLTLTEAVSDASGYVKTELVITNRYAGDNYRVEASVDPAFSCAPNCPKTGILTAWKRVYFENDLMYRRGAFVAIPTTANVVTVTDVRPFLGREGETFEIIQADDITLTGPRRAPYRERHIIGRAVRVGGGHAGELHLMPGDQLSRRYGPGSPLEREFNTALADAVGLLRGSPEEDYYRVGDHLLRRLFAEAFVEYVPLDPAVPVVPYIEFFDRSAGDLRWQMFVSKWSESDPARNHQHLVAGSDARYGGAGAVISYRAEALALDGHSYVVAYVDMMEGLLGSTANNRTLIAEVAAHEMAHLWNTNPRPKEEDSEHCVEQQWDEPGKICQASAQYTCPSGGGSAATCPEFYDNEVSFHYRKHPDGVDSEYLWIRRACEPVPNENVLMPDRWWSQSPPACP